MLKISRSTWGIRVDKERALTRIAAQTAGIKDVLIEVHTHPLEFCCNLVVSQDHVQWSDWHWHHKWCWSSLYKNRRLPKARLYHMYEQKKKRITTFLIYKLTSVSFFSFFLSPLELRIKQSSRPMTVSNISDPTELTEMLRQSTASPRTLVKSSEAWCKSTTQSSKAWRGKGSTRVPQCGSPLRKF